MTNILLDGPDLTANYLREHLRSYLKPYHRVAIVAFSFKDEKVRCLDDWCALYSAENRKYHDLIINPLNNLGIPSENISIINYFTDTKESAAETIRSADVIYFPGGLPDRMMDRIREFELEQVLLQHNGIMIGFSAGALIQLEEYHLSPDDDYPVFCYRNGLPFLRDFYLEVHYEEESIVQNEAIHRVLHERQKPVYTLSFFRGAIIVDQGELKLLGDVNTFDPPHDL